MESTNVKMHRFMLVHPPDVKAGDVLLIFGVETRVQQVHKVLGEDVFEFCRTPSYGPMKIHPDYEVWERIPDPVEVQEPD